MYMPIMNMRGKKGHRLFVKNLFIFYFFLDNFRMLVLKINLKE